MAIQVCVVAFLERNESSTWREKQMLFSSEAAQYKFFPAVNVESHWCSFGTPFLLALATTFYSRTGHWSRYDLVSRRFLSRVGQSLLLMLLSIWLCQDDFTWQTSLLSLFGPPRKKRCEFQSLLEMNSCLLNLATYHDSDTDSTLCFPLKGAKGNYHGVARQLLLALFWHSQHIFFLLLLQYGQFFG